MVLVAHAAGQAQFSGEDLVQRFCQRKCFLLREGNAPTP
jgi:hypothetical protein